MTRTYCQACGAEMEDGVRPNCGDGGFEPVGKSEFIDEYVKPLVFLAWLTFSLCGFIFCWPSALILPGLLATLAIVFGCETYRWFRQ